MAILEKWSRIHGSVHAIFHVARASAAARISMGICMLARTGEIAPIERVRQRDCLAVAAQKDPGRSTPRVLFRVRQLRRRVRRSP
jgi:hypothetical protein